MRKRYQSYYKPRSIKKLENKTKKRIFFSIVFVIVLGYFFLNWGLPYLIGSLSILNKVNGKHQSAHSAMDDPAIAPPVLNIPFEATNSAALKVTGYSLPSSKVEIYLDEDLKDTVETDETGYFHSDDISLSEGTNNIYGKSINDDDKRSLASKTIKVEYSSEKPTLDVSSPSDGQQIKGGDKKITVTGKTDSQNSVMVNGQTAIVNNEGNFAHEVQINDGDNTITIEVTNPVGNSTKIERKVNYSS